MESRQLRLVRKQNRVSKKLIAQSPTATPWSLPNIEDLITYGDITLGVLHPIGCIATASDEDRCLAMLVRRSDETLGQFLIRLDRAIGKAVDEDILTDEINPPHS